MITTTPTQELNTNNSLLNPSKVELVEQLLLPSCLRLINYFGNVANILLHSTEYSAWHNDIEQSIKQLNIVDESIKIRWLSSPLFRSWLYQLGRCLLNPETAGNKTLQLVASWNNMTLLSPQQQDSPKILFVSHGFFTSWDPQCCFSLDSNSIVAYCSSATWTIYDTESQQSIASISLNAMSSGLRVNQHSDFGSLHFLANTSIVIRNDIPQLRLSINETTEPQRHDSIHLNQIDISEVNYPSQYSHSVFKQAFSLIELSNAQLAEQMQYFVQVVVPRGEPKGWTVGGFTESSYQGACWVVEKSVLETMETLVHECGHIHLRYIEEQTPFFTQHNDQLRYLVPWRSDPRPLIGIFEGVFVHLKCALILEQLSNLQLPKYQQAAQIRSKELYQHVMDGIIILQQHGKLTPSGQQIVSWAEQLCTKTGVSIPP